MGPFHREARARLTRPTDALVCNAIHKSTARIIRAGPSTTGNQRNRRDAIMKPGNTRRFSAGSMRVPVRTSILSAILVALSAFAAAPTVPQNTTGRNPGTQVPPGAYIPEELTAAEQTRPHNRSQIGVAGVSVNSFKFGEYNGLNKFHAFAVGNFDYNGGGAYGGMGTWRWDFHGSSLWLETPNGILDFGEQGKFQYRFAYNTILAHTSGSYQTPF